VTITSPASGTVVAPGQSVNVTLVANSGVTLSSVLLVGPSVAQVDSAPPFEIMFQVPFEAVGDYVISAAGTDGAGQYYSSNQVTLVVQPSAALVSLSIAPDSPVLFGAGDTLQLAVVGSYSDGVDRDVTDLGTIFDSANPGIATVSGTGLVTAVTTGAVLVTAEKDSLSTVAQVFVSPTTLQVPALIFSDGFETGNLNPWASVAP